jgi:hypothetical protein
MKGMEKVRVPWLQVVANEVPDTAPNGRQDPPLAPAARAARSRRTVLSMN